MASKPSIRVLIVDDSALVRQMLTHVLGQARDVEVVGVARDGVEALEAIERLTPDVVTLDIQMPNMDGLEALRRIVRDSDARVVMLSSIDDPETTYRALEIGAVEFISKPREGLATSLDRLGADLLRAVRTAAGISPEKRRVVVAPAAPAAMAQVAPGALTATDDPARIVVLAASTGGPLALERVFAGLDVDQRVAYLVVQHLPAGFASSFAARLSRISGLPVEEAQAGMRVLAGHGYVAPHGTHMRVKGSPGQPTRIELVDGPALHGLKPSADPLFESAAKAFGSDVTGVVLTGMGSDAAYGLSLIAQAGGATIAQDEQSSVVWGMPGAAVRLGAAQIVAPIERVAAEVRRTLRYRGGAS